MHKFYYYKNISKMRGEGKCFERKIASLYFMGLFIRVLTSKKIKSGVTSASKAKSEGKGQDRCMF